MSLCMTSVRSLYASVIDGVIGGVRECFLDEGVDEQVLMELKQIWETRLKATKAIDAKVEKEPQAAPLQKPASNTVGGKAPVPTHYINQQGVPVQIENKNVSIQITLPAQQGVPDAHPRLITIDVPASALQGNQLNQILSGPVIPATMALPQHLATSLLQQHVTAALAGQGSILQQQTLQQPTQQTLQQSNPQPLQQSHQQPLQQPHQQPLQQPHQQPLQQSHQQPLQQSHQQPLQQSHQQPLQQSHQQPLQHQQPHPPTLQQSHQQPLQQPHQQTLQQSHELPLQQPHHQPLQQHLQMNNGQAMINPSTYNTQQHYISQATGGIRQLDGNNDTSDEDEEDENPEEEVEDDDIEDDIDEKEDEDNEEKNGGVEEEPLNSEDDVSEEDPTDMFDTENVVVCQYDKITRTRNKWKFYLKDGIMNLGGKDYVFQKSNGDAEW